MDNDIESEGAVVRHEGSQLCRAVDLVVTGALQACLLCRKGTDVQSDYSLLLGLLDCQFRPTKLAVLLLGIKMNCRFIGEETPGVYPRDQLVDGCLKKLQRFECGVFF